MMIGFFRFMNNGVSGNTMSSRAEVQRLNDRIILGFVEGRWKSLPLSQS